MKTLHKATIALAVNAALVSGIAISEEQIDKDKPALEEITVTAQKRTQTIQEVPAAVFAMSDEAVNDYLGSGENIRALAGRVPSLQIESSNGRQSPRFYIRGLGNTDFDVNANQPVSMVLDEINLENSIMKSLPLFDISRVEVLAGPQGTLFGRNTPAGVVKVDSVRPGFDNSGYVRATYGSRDIFSLEGAVNHELSSTVAARASIKYQERGEWIDNVVRNEEVGSYEELAYRLQFLYDDGKDTKALFKIHGFDQDGDMPQVFYSNGFTPGVAGVRPGFDETVIYHDSPSAFNMEIFGLSLNVEHDFENFKFVSITGYDTAESFSQADVDGGQGINGTTCTFDGVIVGQIGCWFDNVATGDGLSDHYQFSQEFRVSNQYDKLFYQAGVYIFEEDITVDSKEFDTTGAETLFTQTDQLTTSFAVFGQIEYDYTEKLAIIAGLRWTSDEKELDIRTGGTDTILFEIDKDDDYFNWDIAARYEFSENVTGFTRYANASRGPVTIGRFGFPSEADTETLNSLEAGIKTVLNDGNVRWNLTLFSYDIEDHQLTFTGGEANTNSLNNIDNTKGQGIETDVEAILTDELRLIANLSYNKTEIQDSTAGAELCGSTPACTSLDPVIGTSTGPFGPIVTVGIDGNSLARAPEWLGNIILNYETPFKEGYIYANTDWNYRSESYTTPYESIEFVAEERWIGGVRVGYKNDEYDVALVGRNITDEDCD